MTTERAVGVFPPAPCQYKDRSGWACKARARAASKYCGTHERMLAGETRRYLRCPNNCERGQGWVFCPYCGKPLPPKKTYGDLAVDNTRLQQEVEQLKAEIRREREAQT